MCAVRSIHILSSTLHSSCVWHEMNCTHCRHIHTCSRSLEHIGLSCMRHSCSQVWRMIKLLKHSSLTLSLDHKSALIFPSFQKKREQSRRNALPLCSVAESTIVLGDCMFELSESEFLKIGSKAKEMLPKECSAWSQTNATKGQIKQPSKGEMMNLQCDQQSIAGSKTLLVSPSLCLWPQSSHLHPSSINKHVICAGILGPPTYSHIPPTDSRETKLNP